jgi:hypothetical protein
MKMPLKNFKHLKFPKNQLNNPTQASLPTQQAFYYTAHRTAKTQHNHQSSNHQQHNQQA